ncbi:hypothetical protein HF563_07595 [Acidithiobacillus ferridurans]|nr:hypothetical protein [Acidithiobacillus ferridurans]
MLTKLESVMNTLQQKRLGPCTQDKEKGIALLGTVLVLSLVMGLLVWSTLVMTRQGAASSYQTNNANQARTAALIGVSAIQQYAQEQFGPLANSSAVANNIPVGSTASAALNIPTPYMAATVSAVVTANTFSATSNSSDAYITANSTGTSGNSTERAGAVLSVQLVSQPLPNRITLNGNATIKGSQFGGATVGAVAGSTINGTTITGNTTIGSLPVNMIISTPIVNPSGFQQYASIELLYNNGGPELIIPQSAESLYSVAPGTYNMTCTTSACTPSTSSTTTSATTAFSTLGITLSPPSTGSLATWTISNQLNGFIYSDSNVNLDLSKGSPYLSVVAQGIIQTLTSKGSDSATGETYNPFAASQDVCNSFAPVCKNGEPIQPLLSVSLISDSGINIANGTTIGGNIGSNGEIDYIGGGSHTVNGNIVATGINASSGSSISISGNTQGNLSSNNNTFGQQQISMSSFYWE